VTICCEQRGKWEENIRTGTSRQTGLYRSTISVVGRRLGSVNREREGGSKMGGHGGVYIRYII